MISDVCVCNSMHTAQYISELVLVAISRVDLVPLEYGVLPSLSIFCD